MGEKKFVTWLDAQVDGDYLPIVLSVYKQVQEQTAKAKVFLRTLTDMTLSVLQLGFSRRPLIVRSHVQSQSDPFVFSGGQSGIWTGFLS